jgi:hypothetical protein
MAQELKIIGDFYDFMLWMTHHTEKFPRHHRYSLGTAIESRMQTILSLLLRAQYGREKREVLDAANIELQTLRFQVRLSKDLKVLSMGSQEHAVALLLGIGTQLGGWIKAAKA